MLPCEAVNVITRVFVREKQEVTVNSRSERLDGVLQEGATSRGMWVARAPANGQEADSLPGASGKKRSPLDSFWTSDLCCYKAPSYWSSVPAAVDGADRHRAWSEACWAHPGTPTRFIQEMGTVTQCPLAGWWSDSMRWYSVQSARS